MTAVPHLELRAVRKYFNVSGRRQLKAVDGVDFTVTAETTAEQIWAETNVNAATSRYPTARSSVGSSARNPVAKAA